MHRRPIAHLAVAAWIAVSALLVPSLASAQCPGDCSTELLDNPKGVEKLVKKAWSAIAKCAKKGAPSCPTECELPDGTASPYSLAQSCVDLVACELDALAAAAYGATWDEGGRCALAAADDCGNASGKATGKLTATKLKRRRTSKMDKFPRDAAKCVGKANKPGACGGETLCAGAGDWIDEIVPIRLSAGGYQSLPFTAPVAGEGKAALTLSAVDADWFVRDQESVVLEYDVDGVAMGTIVVYDGAEATDYRVQLGDLTVGDHTVGLRHSKKLSPAKKSDVLIRAAASATVLESADPGYDALRFAPVLLGIDTKLNPVGTHPGNTKSDVPVVTYVREIPGAGQTTYRYVMIWSNEDGGTGNFPDTMMVKYGRTTDIETYVEVDVADGGALLEVRYRPDESGTLPVFAGAFQGTHPIVRTNSANGLIEDDGESTLRFAMAPFEFNDSGVPREQGMDLDPASYRVMAKEMSREGKVEFVANANAKKLSDLRNYLYVEYDIDVDLGGDVLAATAVVGGVTYRSDHFLPAPGTLGTLFSDGVARTAIELPEGTLIGDVESYGMRGFGSMTGTLNRLDVFMLDPVTYLPGPPLEFSGAQVQSGVNPQWTVTP